MASVLGVTVAKTRKGATAHSRLVPRFTSAVGRCVASGAARGAPGWAALLLSCAVASAQVVNGGFESGNLTGWAVGGRGRAEVLRSDNLSPGITPPEGSYMALLSTTPSSTSGVAAGDLDGNGTQEYDLTTLSVDITVTAPLQTVSFSWAFLTSEENEATAFDDIFDVTIADEPVLSGSVNKPGGISPYPDTPAYDGVAYGVDSAGPTDGSVFANGSTAFHSVCIAIAEPGTYTLSFRVADQADGQVDSGLLIDDVRAPSLCEGITQVTDTSGATLQVKGGGLVFSPHSSRAVAVSDNGAVLAFVSNGNLTGDNPNAENQVFVAEGSVFRRITTMVDGQAGRPSLTSNGRWLAFSATADGNEDVYRVDLRDPALSLQQVTSTTGCSNRDPTVSDDVLGDRIAFTSDCSGDQRVVVWDANGGSPVVRSKGAAGCSAERPAIAQDADGRHVAFLSDCDLTGSNGDHSVEVFRWDLLTDSIDQLTDGASGIVNDGVTASADGRYLAFVSNADPTGENPDGGLEAFRLDTTSGATDQLTDGGPLSFALAADIDDSGRYIAVERMDFLSFVSQVVYVDAQTGHVTPVASGGPSLPAIAVQAFFPVVAFQSADDYVGDNGDGNVEIWKGGAVFSPPKPPLELCSTPGLTIPDNDPTGASDTITVGQPGRVTGLDVSLRVTHTWVGDLVFVLRHVPTGKSVTLIDRPGMPPGGVGCSRNDIEAVLDDGGERPVEDECATSSPAIRSPPSFTPNEPLSTFDGDSLAGDWVLTISDHNRQDTGRLVEWCLLFEQD